MELNARIDQIMLDLAEHGKVIIPDMNISDNQIRAEAREDGALVRIRYNVFGDMVVTLRKVDKVAIL